MIKEIFKNKLLIGLAVVLLSIFLIAQLSGRTLCNCGTSDKFDPTSPGVHHK